MFVSCPEWWVLAADHSASGTTKQQPILVTNSTTVDAKVTPTGSTTLTNANSDASAPAAPQRPLHLTPILKRNANRNVNQTEAGLNDLNKAMVGYIKFDHNSLNNFLNKIARWLDDRCLFTGCGTGTLQSESTCLVLQSTEWPVRSIQLRRMRRQCQPFPLGGAVRTPMRILPGTRLVTDQWSLTSINQWMCVFNVKFYI